METPNQVLIRHEFNAPRELVFLAWTDPEHLKEWFAPNGRTIDFKSIDLRENGTYHSCIFNPEYGNCWCKGSYLEIDFPGKFVFTMEVADENGNSITPEQAGMPADWPATTTVTVTFTQKGDKTELILQQTVTESLAKMTGAHPSWLQMLARLEQKLQP